MAKKIEPIGEEPLQPEQSFTPQRLIRILLEKLKSARRKGEDHQHPELAKGFSVQEQLDILTERYGEDAVTGLKKELLKPNKKEDDIDNPFRILESVSIITDQKTGELRIASAWKTDIGRQETIDPFLNIYDISILDAIGAAPADIQEKIFSYLKDARERMLYLASGNERQPVFIVRNNQKTKAGYAVFLRYPLDGTGPEKNVTNRIPKDIRMSIQTTGAGNADPLFQTWIHGSDDAKKIKEEEHASFARRLLEKDIALSKLISRIHTEGQKEAAENAVKTAMEIATRTERNAQEAAERKTAHETSYKKADDAFQEVLAQKTKAATEAVQEAQKETERMRATAEVAMETLSLPPHLETYKEFLKKQRDKEGLPLSIYDIKKIQSNYTAWKAQEDVEARAKAATDATEKKAQEEAAAKAKTDAEKKAEVKKKAAEETAKKTKKKKPEDKKDKEDIEEKEENLPPQEGLTLAERRWYVAKTIAQIVGGVVLTLSGLRFALTLGKYVQDSWNLRGLGKDREAILAELEKISYAWEQSHRADTLKDDDTEKETAKKEAQDTQDAAVQQLEEKIQDLADRGILTEEHAGQFRTQLQQILRKTAEDGEGITQETEKRVHRALDMYIQRRVTKTEVFKQGLNLGSVLLGLQTIRAVSYFTLSVWQRAQRALAEESKVRMERGEYEEPTLKDVLWKDLLASQKDFWEGIGGTGENIVDLFRNERVSQTDWTRRTQSSAKAWGNLLVFAGMAGIAGAEIHGTGSIHQMDTLLHNLETKGWGETIADNFFLRFGARHEAEHTEHQEETTPEQQDISDQQEHAQGEQHSEESVAPAQETQETLEDFRRAHPLLFNTPSAQEPYTPAINYLSAEEQLPGPEVSTISINYLSADPDRPGIFHGDISFGIHGDYQALDQFLRRFAVDSMDPNALHGHGVFDHIDAARAENIAANIRNALLGSHETPLHSDQLHGVAHYDHGHLIIDDYKKFIGLAKDLFPHAEHTITEQSGALNFIDNTSHDVWQKIWDVKMQGQHHIPVGDFSSYHHEPPHHTPAHHEIAPTETHQHTTHEGETALSPQERSSPAETSNGGASPFSNHEIPGIPQQIVLNEIPVSPEVAASFPPLDTPHTTSAGTEAASTSVNTNQSAQQIIEEGAREIPHTDVPHWAATDFFQEFSHGTFDEKFFAAAHENPVGFTAFFVERLSNMRDIYGQNYYSYLSSENIQDAAKGAHFQTNVSELLHGVLKHEKDTIDLTYDGFGNARFHAQPKE